jgi:hypothetical protein
MFIEPAMPVLDQAWPSSALTSDDRWRILVVIATPEVGGAVAGFSARMIMDVVQR